MILTCVSLLLTCIYVLKSNKINKTNKAVVETVNKEKVKIYEETNSTNNTTDKEFNVAVVGDIMMGGKIGEKLSYNYMSAFKNVAEYTAKADYTICNFTTNIIDLPKINDVLSKYITTKKVVNALNALGIDGINIASDHMLDFGVDVFNDTKNILKEDYDIIGSKDSITYIENDGIKIAVIGVTNEIIGNTKDFDAANIMTYNLKKIKSMIKDAKQNANTVILMTHLGLENSHTVTNVMSWFYKQLIDYGADIVMGSHALGVYPIEEYKSKYIIYSMGYFMSDTDYDIGKKSAIFDLKIDKDGYLNKIQITPVYINAKCQTILYEDYNKSDTEKFIKYLTSNIKDYKIEENKIIIDVAK